MQRAIYLLRYVIFQSKYSKPHIKAIYRYRYTHERIVLVDCFPLRCTCRRNDDLEKRGKIHCCVSALAWPERLDESISVIFISGSCRSVEELVTVLTAFLGVIHGSICIPHQCVGIEPVFRVDADTDTQGYLEFVSIDNARQRKPGQ